MDKGKSRSITEAAYLVIDEFLRMNSNEHREYTATPAHAVTAYHLSVYNYSGCSILLEDGPSVPVGEPRRRMIILGDEKDKLYEKLDGLVILCESVAPVLMDGRKKAGK